MLGLADPPRVPGLRLAFAPAVLAPPARPALPGLGRAGGGGAGAAFAVAQVLAAFGPDGPPGYQQPLSFRPGGGVGVDDAQVDPGGPGRIRPLPSRVTARRGLRRSRRHTAAPRHSRGSPTGPARPGRGRPGPAGGSAAGSRAPPGAQPPPVQRERAVIPAHRHQAAPAPRVPGALVTLLAAFRSGEPGVAVAAQHRPGAGAASSRTCPARRRPVPGTRPAAGPAGTAATRSVPARSTTRRRPTAAARTPAPADRGSRAARTARCGALPAVRHAHVFEA